MCTPFDWQARVLCDRVSGLEQGARYKKQVVGISQTNGMLSNRVNGLRTNARAAGALRLRLRPL
jgi:hypothetical protein